MSQLYYAITMNDKELFKLKRKLKYSSKSESLKILKQVIEKEKEKQK